MNGQIRPNFYVGIHRYMFFYEWIIYMHFKGKTEVFTEGFSLTKKGAKRITRRIIRREENYWRYFDLS